MMALPLCPNHFVEAGAPKTFDYLQPEECKLKNSGAQLKDNLRVGRLSGKSLGIPRRL